MLDPLLTSPTELSDDIRIAVCLGCSDHAVVEFTLLRDRGQTKNRTIEWVVLRGTSKNHLVPSSNNHCVGFFFCFVCLFACFLKNLTLWRAQQCYFRKYPTLHWPVFAQCTAKKQKIHLHCEPTLKFYASVFSEGQNVIIQPLVFTRRNTAIPQ